MQSARVRVAGPWGMHARYAFRFAKMSEKYKSVIKISYKNRSGNGKKVMDLLTLGAGPDSCVVIETDGEDETAAMESLTRFLNAGE